MLIGYARVSTDDQHLDLQLDALEAAGLDPARVYREHASGARSDRPALTECLRSLREGDTLVIWRLDRLGRSVQDLLALSQRLKTMGVNLRSLTETIDTSTAIGGLVFTMIAAMAEFERRLIQERTMAGLKAARARGRRGGRPRKLTPAKLRIAKALLADDKITAAEAAAQVGVSRATLQRELAAERKRAEHALAA